jgi:hypothetical protein
LSTAKYKKPAPVGCKSVEISIREYRRLLKDAARWRWYVVNVFKDDGLDAYDKEGLIKIVDDRMKGKIY